MSGATPYQSIKRGNLFVVPVGSTVAEVPHPVQELTRPPDYSLWVHGRIHEPGPDLDRARLSPRLYREVRDDLARYSPVEVTRSAIRRATHAYVGVIDSRGTPYYFALDSRGVSVREASPADAAWKAFDRMAEDEHMSGVRERRSRSAAEMVRVDRELSAPQDLVVTKGTLRYGKEVDWERDVPGSTWWRNPPKTKKREGRGRGRAAAEPAAPPKTKKREGRGRGRAAAEPAAPAAGREDAAAKAIGTDLIALSAEAAEERRRRFGNRYAAEYRRAGHELWLQLSDGESELDPPRPEDALYVDKALPKKAKEDKAKKTPSRKASKKKAGASGKTRYTYPGEKKKKKAGGSAGAQKPTPLVVAHDDTRHADPAELANQLGVSVRTLERAARRLGRDRFSSFMRSRLKRFAAKHRLDPDYWGTLYVALTGAAAGDPVAKSEDEAAWKKFGHDVKEAASAVPHDHAERFGDRKVFIHHVHSEMKRHGTYSGDLDKFKEHVVAAHKRGHIDASRADFVSAMNPHSVRQSETDAKGATFHFINNVKHDPEAAGRLSSGKAGGSAKQKPRMSRGFHREVAQLSSGEAHEATAHAQKTGTAEAHSAAMTAHHHAGVAHQKASGKVNDKTAKQHFDQAIVHAKAAKAG